jgi:hypothetical protein
MHVIKASGAVVPFSPDKIRASLERIGTAPAVVKTVLAAVAARAKEGMTTRDLYALVRAELERADRGIAQRYNLRTALLKLGPAGFNFEKYVAAVLHAYQYDVELPAEDVRGLCVAHEVDVVARKAGKTAFIEAKFRNAVTDVVSLKDTMATWSRYLDLVDGHASGTCERFDEAWIVTNGRFSERAHQFGVCKGVHMVSWSGSDHSLARMVDHAALYPITVVEDVLPDELQRLASADYLLCREISEKMPAALAKATGIGEQRAQHIVQACALVVKPQQAK